MTDMEEAQSAGLAYHEEMKTILDLKRGFITLVESSEPFVLKAFARWLDVKLAEFKVYGCFHKKYSELGKASKEISSSQGPEGNEIQFLSKDSVICSLQNDKALQNELSNGKVQPEHPKIDAQGQLRLPTSTICNTDIETNEENEGKNDSPVYPDEKKTLYQFYHNNVEMARDYQSQQNGCDYSQYSEECFDVNDSMIPNFFSQMSSDYSDTIEKLRSTLKHQSTEFQLDYKFGKYHAKECDVFNRNIDTTDRIYQTPVESERVQLQDHTTCNTHLVNANESQIHLSSNYHSSQHQNHENQSNATCSHYQYLFKRSADARTKGTPDGSPPKRGPPELIAFRDDEPVEQWNGLITSQWQQNGSVTSQLQQNENIKMTSQHQRQGLTTPALQDVHFTNGAVQNTQVKSESKNSSVTATVSHFRNEYVSVTCPSSDCGLDLSGQVQIIEPNLNQNEPLFHNQTAFSQKMKNKVYRCQICRRILLNCAGYNRHIKTHMKFNCQNCGLLCEGRHRKTHICTSTLKNQVSEQSIEDTKKFSPKVKPEVCSNKQDFTDDVTSCNNRDNDCKSHNSEKEKCGRDNDADIKTLNGETFVDEKVILSYKEETNNTFSSPVSMRKLPKVPEHEFTITCDYPEGDTTGPSADVPEIRGHFLQGLACPICLRQFVHLSSLNRHLKVHQGVYTHACVVCGRRFTRNEHFQQHKCSRRPKYSNRMVEKDRPLECSAKLVTFPP